MVDVKLAPIRTLDDFILQTDRFGLPDLRILSKWNSRVVGNLLYYQTNYLIGLVVLFGLIAMLNPVGLVIGFVCLALSSALLMYLQNNQPIVRSFQSDHPIAVVAAVFAVGWIMVYLVDCVAVFLFATLLPVLLMFLHSSCRKRGLRNKINDALETAGLKKTPMGIILDYVQVEFDKDE